MEVEARNYPLNCWWVAARSEEITRTPFQRWLLDTPVVLYRDEAGHPVALDNRCPHRWAPLSDGYLEGDNIVCPYHGARFAPDGHCPQFPGQDTVTKKMRVRSFALVERGQFVWIWMGDEAAREAADLPPDHAWSKTPGWYITTGDFEFDANYMLLHENVLDLTHFNYVHARTFQFENWNASPENSVDGNRVGFSQSFPKAELNEHEQNTMGLGSPDADTHVTSGWFETPAWHSAGGVVYAKPGSSVAELWHTKIAHMVTPASPTHTYYWWVVGTDAEMPEEAKAVYGQIVLAAYTEDKVILESMQRLLEMDPRGANYPEVTFSGDAAGMLARAALNRLLAAERNGVVEPFKKVAQKGPG